MMFLLDSPKYLALCRIRLLLTILGTFIAFVLTSSYLLGKVPACGDEGGCSIVALSKLAYLGPVPTPAFGLAAFIFLAACAFIQLAGFVSPIVRLGPSVTALAFLVNTALSIYAHFVIKAFCPWCLASNTVLGALAGTHFFGTHGAFRTGICRVDLCGGTVALVALCGACIAYSLVPGSKSKELPYSPAKLRTASLSELWPADVLSTRQRPDPPRNGLVIFVDLQCPVCGKEFLHIKEFASRHRLDLALRHLPLGVYPGSERIAIIVEAASSQSKGWAVIDHCLPLAKDLNVDGWTWYARKLGVRLDNLQINSGAALRVQRDKAFAYAIGIKQTPVVILLRNGAPEAGFVGMTWEEGLRQMFPEKPGS